MRTNNVCRNARAILNSMYLLGSRVVDIAIFVFFFSQRTTCLDIRDGHWCYKINVNRGIQCTRIDESVCCSQVKRITLSALQLYISPPSTYKAIRLPFYTHILWQFRVFRKKTCFLNFENLNISTFDQNFRFQILSERKNL